jgi:hypothetical protein
MNYLLFILLGSHVDLLLNGRVNTAIDFATSVPDRNNTHIDWFLSGGVKYANGLAEEVTEAEKMSHMITNGKQDNNWSFVLDTKATNTAENFIIAQRATEFEKYSDVYVITSAFHYNRAKLIADLSIENNRFKWILSDNELHDSKYWETVHIKNVKTDVERAKDKLTTQRERANACSK